MNAPIALVGLTLRSICFAVPSRHSKHFIPRRRILKPWPCSHSLLRPPSSHRPRLFRLAADQFCRNLLKGNAPSYRRRGHRALLAASTVVALECETSTRCHRSASPCCQRPQQRRRMSYRCCRRHDHMDRGALWMLRDPQPQLHHMERR